MITSVAFTVSPFSNMERTPAFPLDCLDRPFTPISIFGEQARIQANAYRRITPP